MAPSREGGSQPAGAFHLNVSVVLFDNPVHLGQPQPGPFAHLLGGKKGLKQALPGLGRDAGPAVGHLRADPAGRVRLRDVLGGRQRNRVGEGKAQVAPGRHRVAGVQRQVQHHLLQAGRVGHNGGVGRVTIKV